MRKTKKPSGSPPPWKTRAAASSREWCLPDRLRPPPMGARGSGVGDRRVVDLLVRGDEGRMLLVLQVFRPLPLMCVSAWGVSTLVSMCTRTAALFLFRHALKSGAAAADEERGGGQRHPGV